MSQDIPENFSKYLKIGAVLALLILAVLAYVSTYIKGGYQPSEDALAPILSPYFFPGPT